MLIYPWQILYSKQLFLKTKGLPALVCGRNRPKKSCPELATYAACLYSLHSSGAWGQMGGAPRRAYQLSCGSLGAEPGGSLSSIAGLRGWGGGGGVKGAYMFAFYSRTAKVIQVSFADFHTAKNQYRKFETKELRSQFPHSCVCERFVYIM